MADNVTSQTAPASSLPPGTAVATDQLPDGTHAQRVKLLNGAADSTTVVRLDETAAGLKVDGSAVVQPVSGTVTVVDSVPLSVSGTVAVSGTLPVSAAALPLPAGAAQDSSLATGNASLATMVTALAANTQFNATLHTELLSAILTELKINNALLQSGLNVRDDLDNMRTDPYFLQ